jgi:streptogramin lyase
VWFTENNVSGGGSTARGVASITPSGQITEFPVSGGGAAFFNIIAGGDGNLWFDTYGGKLLRMTPQGAATMFAVPGVPANFSSFTWAPDGNIWITTFDRVFRYQPGGAATPFTIPTPNADARQIVSTSMDLWFPEFQGSRLARISTSGVFTEFPLPGSYPSPSFLCLGGGGDVWLTEPNSNRVWRFQVTEPTGFATLPPCRVFDTRDPDGPLGGPVLAAGAPRGFTVAGACGVPANALSISANVTVVGATGSGYVGVYSGGGADPQLAIVNVAGAGARANNLIIQLSTDRTGGITVANHTNGSVHVVLDVNGYFR